MVGEDMTIRRPVVCVAARASEALSFDNVFPSVAATFGVTAALADTRQQQILVLEDPRAK